MRLPVCFTSCCLLVAVAALIPSVLSADAVPFGSRQQIVGGIDGAWDVRAADLDGDGAPDVVGHGAIQRYLQNSGDGSAWTLTELGSGTRLRQIELADLDGDGDLDLVYTDWGAERTYRRMNSAGTFGAPSTLGPHVKVDGVMAGDLDGDTDLDLVVTGREIDRYYWLENDDGTGTSWTTHELASDLDGPNAVWIADLDGDGDLDVVGIGSEAGGQLVWHENAAGDASEWITTALGPGWFDGVSVGDIDHDGDPDIVVQQNDAGPSPSDRFVWWENSAGDASSWVEHVIGPAGRDASKGLQLVDLDYDGDLDLVGSRNGDWYDNTAGDASAWTLRNYDAADDDDIHDTDVADLDGDGDLDVVGAQLERDRLSWWPNLTCTLADSDDDGDGARNACDRCPGSDDSLDEDEDGVPDGCDQCPGGDDRVDVDDDDNPDACNPGGTLAIDDVTAAESNAGTVDFTFTVSLSGGGGAGGFTIDYTTQDSSATTGDGGDYAEASGTLSFSGLADETKTITVSVQGDTVLEDDEAFTVELGMPSTMAVTVADGSGQGTILNDDAAALSISDAALSEGDAGSTDLVFVVTLTGDVETSFAVDYASQDGSATTADGDYVGVDDSLTFDGFDGETEMLSVSVLGDGKLETDEDFTVVLGMRSYAAVTLGDGTGTGTVFNDDSASIAIGDVSAAEGDSGSTDFSFAVTLTGEVQDGFSVSASTQDDGAVAPGDYADTTGLVVFDGSAGATELFTVSVAGDTVVEGDETFLALLGMPSNPAVGVTDDEGLGTIQNDDSASVAVADVSLLEGDAGTSDFTFTATLSGDVQGGFAIGWSTADSSATTADGDYAAAGGTLVFAGTDGETEDATVSVSGDAVVEGDETFFLLLSPPSAASVSVDGSAVGTILNDDSATLAIGDIAAAEGDGDSTAFELPVALSGTVAAGVTVGFATRNGSAAAGSDYDGQVGFLSFDGADGETETVSVVVHGDTEYEDDETFFVDLTSSSNSDVTFSDDTGQALISNDDILLTVVVEGLGVVTSDPEGIDCGDDGGGGGGGGGGGKDCDEVFPIDSTVDLTATPASGWSFAGWSDDADCADGSVTLTVDTNCTATFEPPVGRLTIEFADDGYADVTSTPAGIDCSREDLSFGGPRTDCVSSFELGVDVDLDLEVTSPDTTFDGWTGDADCADGTVSFASDGEAKTCVAVLPVTPFFADGFESGDASAWSATVP